MKKRIIYHIAFWVAYVLFKSYLQFESASDTLNLTMLVRIVTAQMVFLVIKIPLVYGMFFVLEKYLTKQWNAVGTIFSMAGLFIVSTVLFQLIKQLIVLREIYNVDASIGQAFGFSSLLSTIFILGFVCSAALAIKLIRTNIQQRAEQQEMVKRKLETELKFLKAQINPHFFFNTLNNIYALARKKSDETPGVVMKLSELFRFILYESSKKHVTIHDEVKVLENYIELERIRYNQKLTINFVKSIDNEMQLMAPLVLLPFVENAFKHGASESRFSSDIHIHLTVAEGVLTFSSENSKAEQLEKNETEQIGLANIRRQLELLYPDHELTITNRPTSFKVFLKLNLNAHSQI
jgi:two-component system LytT family sensor kinase